MMGGTVRSPLSQRLAVPREGRAPFAAAPRRAGLLGVGLLPVGAVLRVLALAAGSLTLFWLRPWSAARGSVRPSSPPWHGSATRLPPRSAPPSPRPSPGGPTWGSP